ncbi:MAG: hypothetical protein M0R51_14250 [Clostridia bacterium]|jgi:hypothetical protein|nr:hypothetical protein [Clostridia bacterium]
MKYYAEIKDGIYINKGTFTTPIPYQEDGHIVVEVSKELYDGIVCGKTNEQ